MEDGRYTGNGGVVSSYKISQNTVLSDIMLDFKAQKIKDECKTKAGTEYWEKHSVPAETTLRGRSLTQRARPTKGKMRVGFPPVPQKTRDISTNSANHMPAIPSGSPRD